MTPPEEVSYCGLDCEACDAFVATRDNDNQLRTQVARRWSTLYNREVRPEDVYCRGCKSEGTQGIYCQTICPIKPCCREKGFTTCAECGAFPCKDLKAVFDFCPEARERLERLRDR
ncbi:MAG: DUF3795 domain-containing protein [Desulfobacterales bacterium]|nr:DUF3795 domain-containing protein [Desulfobacterales bacterium]